jgi:hypothetical protein
MAQQPPDGWFERIRARALALQKPVASPGETALGYAHDEWNAICAAKCRSCEEMRARGNSFECLFCRVEKIGKTQEKRIAILQYEMEKEGGPLPRGPLCTCLEIRGEGLYYLQCPHCWERYRRETIFRVREEFMEKWAYGLDDLL